MLLSLITAAQLAVPAAALPAETAATDSDPITLYAVSSDSSSFADYTPISSQKDLLAINNDPAGKYYLTGDITLSGNWTPLASFSGVLDGNGQGVLNGYKALATTNMATGLGDGSDEHGIVFGNWADYFLGQWGALDIVVDPYSAATESVVKVTITMWANMGMIRPESFAIGTLK